MADSAGKRLREAKKRQQREMKAERKRLRKEGLLGNDNSGLFAPGEMQRQVVDVNEPQQVPPAEDEAKPGDPQ